MNLPNDCLQESPDSYRSQRNGCRTIERSWSCSSTIRKDKTSEEDNDDLGTADFLTKVRTWVSVWILRRYLS
jgi:hypothetical protein